MSDVPPRSDDVDAPSPKASGPMAQFLSFVEWLGNLLPHPVTLFALFALAVVVASAVSTWAGLSVEDPRPGNEGEFFVTQSLLSGEGVRWMSQSLVTNFTGFVPLI